jgi:hypothetical protein
VGLGLRMLPSTIRDQARADKMFGRLIAKGLSEDDIYAWWESATAIAGSDRTPRMLWSDGNFETVEQAAAGVSPA